MRCIAIFSMALAVVLSQQHVSEALMVANLDIVFKAKKVPKPFVIPLRREVVPVQRNGEIVSYKTSHSGIIHVGKPRQAFRVVFDTGSGHVILPSSECKSEACLEHRRYDIKNSEGAIAINMDGSRVPKGVLCDQVTIGFGTGSVTGEFVKEQVCVGTCVNMNMVMAVEMSVQPFKSFLFDGILGLGLSRLSLSPSFSFLTSLKKTGQVPESVFGVYLTEGDNKEDSEIALGGTNPERYHGALDFVSVAKPELGHWQVTIKSLRVGNRTIGNCENGTCRGIVDTGTSHLGIPGAIVSEVADLLTVTVGSNVQDCTDAIADPIEIELEGTTLRLFPRNYMRRLPLKDGVIVGSANGVSLSPEPPEAATSTNTTEGEEKSQEAPAEEELRRCKPRLMPVNLPAPLGPNLFLLGEPVLHRYYTVYDWEKLKIGFAVAGRGPKHIDGDDAAAAKELPTPPPVMV